MRKLRGLLTPDASTSPSASPVPAWLGRGAWWDCAIAVVLGLATAAMAYRNGLDLNPAIYEWVACDVYFDADTPRVLLDMTGRFNDHYRTRVHPLFPLITIPPEKIFEKGLGMSEIAASRLLTACAGGLWTAGLFALFRLIGCRRPDATVFSALGAASGAAMFWFILPDTYPFASLSMLAALLVVAVTRRRPVPTIIAVAVSAFTLSITITQFMAGLAMAICAYPLRKAVGISVAAVVFVIALWCVEKALMPSVRFPLSDKEEAKYVLQEEAGGPVRIAASFFLHTMVVPEPTTRILDLPGQWTKSLIVQMVNPGFGSVMGLIAVVMWGALLVIGVLAMLAGAGDRRFRMMVALVLAGQLVLHLLYGSETFVYSLHFAPLLLTIAAMGSLTRLRPIVLMLAAATTVLACAHNLQSLRASKAFLNGPHEVAPDLPAATAPGT